MNSSSNITTDYDYGPSTLDVWFLNSNLPSSLWWASYVLQAYVLGFLDVLGVILNALSFITLHNERGKRCSQTTLLQALAVFDSLYLITNMAFFPVGAIVVVNTGSVEYHKKLIGTYMCILQMTRLFALYAVVLVTFDRFVAIRFPLKAHSFCTTKSVLIQIFVLVIYVCLVELVPRYLFPHIINRDYVNFTYTTITLVTTCVVPVFLVFAFNIGIISALYASRKMTGQKSDSHKQLTRRLLAVSTTFLVCNVPLLIEGILLQVYSDVSDAYVENIGWALNYILLLSILCVAVNSSTNFVVYCLTGARFRKTFVNTFCAPCKTCVCPHYDKDSPVKLTFVKKRRGSFSNGFTLTKSDCATSITSIA
ncbi:FMRFamide peptide receptor frpr-18-like [Tubulanus polymorphus]|uniref:FMRFamide peptide receptor frpr-18-like n=1 Tax=Tubulanus polymorphus TaxID=672921 RepID=UPI003DA44403